MTTVSGPCRRRHAQPRVGRQRRHLPGDEFVRQRQVDEARAADLHRRADVAQRGRRHDLLGHLARRSAHLLREGERAVGLEVGAVGHPQHGVGARHHRVEGGLETFQEDAGGVGHPSFSHAARLRRASRASVGRGAHGPVE